MANEERCIDASAYKYADIDGLRRILAMLEGHNARARRLSRVHYERATCENRIRVANDAADDPASLVELDL